MFPQQPTPRRTATSPDQQTHEVGLHDQREARHHWVWQLKRVGRPLGRPTPLHEMLISVRYISCAGLSDLPC
jgi:hypothetical protein